MSSRAQSIGLTAPPANPSVSPPSETPPSVDPQSSPPAQIPSSQVPYAAKGPRTKEQEPEAMKLRTPALAEAAPESRPGDAALDLLDVTGFEFLFVIAVLTETKGPRSEEQDRTVMRIRALAHEAMASRPGNAMGGPLDLADPGFIFALAALIKAKSARTKEKERAAKTSMRAQAEQVPKPRPSNATVKPLDATALARLYVLSLRVTSKKMIAGG